MLSFNDLYTTAQDATGDTNSSTLVFIKQWINQGTRIMQSALGRYWTRRSQTANIVASQQYYQLPEDCIRPSEVVVTVSSVPHALEEIASEHRWRLLNQQNTSNTGTTPIYYFVRGKDEIGLWPTPSTSLSGALEVAYEPMNVDMAAADYTTGTISISNGSASVTGSGTTFTSSMAGRYLQVSDGTHSLWYRIASYSSATSITLENTYAGTTVAGATYKIGELPNLPGDLHDSLVDYASFRYALRRKSNDAAEFKALWDSSLDNARERYSAKSTSRVLRRKSDRRLDWKWANNDNIAS